MPADQCRCRRAVGELLLFRGQTFPRKIASCDRRLQPCIVLLHRKLRLPHLNVICSPLLSETAPGDTPDPSGPGCLAARILNGMFRLNRCPYRAELLNKFVKADCSGARGISRRITVSHWGLRASRNNGSGNLPGRRSIERNTSTSAEWRCESISGNLRFVRKSGPWQSPAALAGLPDEIFDGTNFVWFVRVQRVGRDHRRDRQNGSCHVFGDRVLHQQLLKLKIGLRQEQVLIGARDSASRLRQGDRSQGSDFDLLLSSESVFSASSKARCSPSHSRSVDQVPVNVLYLRNCRNDLVAKGNVFNLPVITRDADPAQVRDRTRLPVARADAVGSGTSVKAAG